MGTWTIDPDREVALVGAGLAAAAGLVLFASPFVAWYQQPALCVLATSCGANVSGFSSLGPASAVLVFAAAAGFMPLVAAVIDGRANRLAHGGGTGAAIRLACGVAAGAGFGAALFVLFRIAAAPSHPTLTNARLAGPFIALLGAVGVSGGSAVAGLGRRMFDRAPLPLVTLAVVAAGSFAMIVSLSIKWVRASPGFSYRAATETAWQAAPTLAVILLLGAIALLGASALVAVIQWRAAFFALAIGGWLAAAIAAVGIVLATRLPSGGPVRPLTSGSVSGLFAYKPGYYICLGGAAVVVFAGLWGALAGPEPAPADRG